MANLLIIDDDLQASTLLATLLRREGHDVECATTVGDGLSTLRRHDPDLVLLDLGLPRVDGLDLLDALMGEPRFAHLRVVVYTGRDEPEVREAARRLGAREFIVKGTDWEHIYERIRSVLAEGTAPVAGGATVERPWEGRSHPA
jgi:DNA-binding response OmpR family regulator